MKTLRLLTLRNNRLQKLPAWITNLNNIHRLNIHLTGNQLAPIAQGWIERKLIPVDKSHDTGDKMTYERRSYFQVPTLKELGARSIIKYQ